MIGGKERTRNNRVGGGGLLNVTALDNTTSDVNMTNMNLVTDHNQDTSFIKQNLNPTGSKSILGS